jgi:anaphase-promoting complex subunit 6
VLQFLMQAKSICSTDPVVYNELGVMAFRNKDYEAAARWLRKALSLAPPPLTEAWEPTVVNLAHTLRKLKSYVEAISMYEKALALYPKGASTYAALGFTHHLQGSTGKAIDFYHKALGLKSDDTFTAEMLTTALTEECTRLSSAPDSQFFSLGVGLP